MRRLLLSSLLLVCMTVFAVAGQVPAPRHVNLTAPDGTLIKATYYPAAKAGPGVVLLHMCNSERQAWRDVGRALAAAGIHAIAVDYRGYGESGGDRFANDAQKQQALINEKWPGDMDAAFAYLASQTGVDKSRIGAGGGSCGVNQAIRLASRHPEVRSLVLLAGGADRVSREYLTKNVWLPIFSSAATDDGFDGQAPLAMRWYAEFTGNPRNKFVGFEEGGHGTQMFGPHPELVQQITAWYVDTLVKSPASAGDKIVARATPAAEFWRVLDQPGGVEQAVQMFREARDRDPKAYLFPEGVMNQMAYEKLQAGQLKEAVALAKLNTEAYPNSPNAYDSLGDAYLAAGERELALQATRKAIAMIEADKDPENAQFFALIRQSADGKLKQLQPEAAKQD